MFDYNVFDRFGTLVGQCNHLPTAEQLVKCYLNGSVVAVERPAELTAYESLLVDIADLVTGYSVV